MIAEQMRRWLREPLVHFLLAGVAIFAFYSWRGSDVDPASRTITVTEEEVSRLVASWQQTWQRPPSPAEIDGLIRDRIKEEVYYREALRLGLDADDSVIRRRLRSKMEYLARAQAEVSKADDAVLQAWLDRDPARYAADVRYSFDQIYMGDADVASVRTKLAGGKDWKSAGQPISLPNSIERTEQADIARGFGAAFADALSQLKPGGWQGPVSSGFGQHLVRLRERSAVAKPKLDDVRQAVENDWRAATLREREAKAYQALLDGYTIRIEKP